MSWMLKNASGAAFARVRAPAVYGRSWKMIPLDRNELYLFLKKNMKK
jgi:hypothetical protein